MKIMQPELNAEELKIQCNPPKHGTQKVWPKEPKRIRKRDQPEIPSNIAPVEGPNICSSPEGSIGGHKYKIQKGNQEEAQTVCFCNRNYEEGDRMIECDGECKKWYHIECVGISFEEFKKIEKDATYVWKCKKCKEGKPLPIIIKPSLTEPPEVSAINEQEKSQSLSKAPNEGENQNEKPTGSGRRKNKRNFK